MEEELKQLWTELESTPDAAPGERAYRNLGLANETGLRLSCVFPERNIEFLIEVDESTREEELGFPSWHGMQFNLVSVNTPKPNSSHIALRLVEADLKEVFITVCADMAVELEAVDAVSDRKRAFKNFVERWSRFFARNDPKGLSGPRQQGLMGELLWLHRLLTHGVPNDICLDSWKGCDRSYHDFEISGRVVEVKTTKSKEPRKVWINNERQLDDRGLVSLHLLVLTLVVSEKGGRSLPEMVELLREQFAADAAHQRLLKLKLQSAGYLDTHAERYTASYTVKVEELFKLTERIPRLLDIPSGLGDLKYSLLVASCSREQIDADDYLTELKAQ